MLLGSWEKYEVDPMNLHVWQAKPAFGHGQKDLMNIGYCPQRWEGWIIRADHSESQNRILVMTYQLTVVVEFA